MILQHCNECGRTWEYTPTRSICPKCMKRVVIIKAEDPVINIGSVFSAMRDKIRQRRSENVNRSS